MARAIDAGSLKDNLTDTYGDINNLIYLYDVLDLIDAQPTLTPPDRPMTLKEIKKELKWIADALEKREHE